LAWNTGAPLTPEQSDLIKEKGIPNTAEVEAKINEVDDRITQLYKDIGEHTDGENSESDSE
jgi:hypothetical protein